MKSSVKTPASLRYMKARLRPFSRLSFWGALIIISVFGVVIYQYWQNPELLRSTSTNPEATNKALKNPNFSQISSEDLAVGVDLDNVDLLLNELNSQTEVPFNSTSRKSSKNPVDNNNKDTIYNQFREKQKSQLNNSSTSTNSNNLANPIIPNLSNFNSVSPLTNSQKNKNNDSSENLVPNPIGRLYLSNRNQTLNQVNNSTPETTESNNLNNTINSENNIIQNPISPPQQINSSQTVSPQINYSINPTVINNNSAIANPLTTPYSTENNVINYQLPVVNYSNIQANPSTSLPVQNQNSRQSNQPNNQNNGLLQPSALNQPQF